MRRHRLALVWLTAQAGITFAAEPPAAAMPEWLEKALAREADPKPAQAVAGLKGAFKAQVPARVLAPPVSVGDTQYVTLDVGAGTPMECWVYDDEKDPAQSLRALAEETFTSLEGRQGKIEARMIQATDAGAIGAAPFLGVDWFYRVRQADAARAGQVKQLIATKNERSIYCAHAEIGYSRTFARVFHDLVESIEFASTADGPVAAPYYVEISTAAVANRRLGFVRFAYTLDKDGDTRIVDQTSMVLPADAQTLNTRDNYRVQFSAPDGRLLNEVAVEAEGGEVVTHLKLQPGKEGGWSVTGTLKSKPFEASLGEAAIKSDLGQMLALRDLAAKATPGADVKYLDWTDEDPGRFNEVVYKVGKVGEGGFEGTMTFAHLNMAVVVDGTGSIRGARMPTGATALEIRRVYVGGTAPAAPDAPASAATSKR